MSYIVEWINTFEGLSQRPNALEELCDGVILFEVAARIAPAHFSLDSVTTNADGNWALRANNLKKLMRELDYYYRDVLGLEGGDLDDGAIDATKIGRDNDLDELTKLVELVLGCAVQCEDKQQYIEKIMQMGAESQEQLMFTIQSVMGRFTSRASTIERSSSLDIDAALKEAVEAKEALESSVTQFRRRAETAESDNVGLRKQLEDFRELEKERQQQDQARENEVASQNDELRRNAKEREFTEAQISDLRAELQESQQQAEQMQQLAEQQRTMLEAQIQQQADELDIARSQAAQLQKAEATIQKYKRKLELVDEVKGQIKELEEQNSKYLDQIINQEATIKSIDGLKLSLERYKDQAVDLETKSIEMKSSIEVKAEQVKHLQGELEAANSAKEFLEEQYEQLRREHEEREEETPQVPTTGAGIFEGVTELRERCARLEHENADLREGASGAGASDDNAAHLMSQLDDMKSVKGKLEASASESAKRCARLEQEVVQLRAHAEAMENDASGHSVANAEQATLLDRLRSELSESTAAKSALAERLKAKESEINALTSDKEKLETYTKRTLHAVQHKYMVTMQSHKNQLQEKQEAIERLEMKMSQMRQAGDREKRLMTSSFYELGVHLLKEQTSRNPK